MWKKKSYDSSKQIVIYSQMDAFGAISSLFRNRRYHLDRQTCCKDIEPFGQTFGKGMENHSDWQTFIGYAKNFFVWPLIHSKILFY